MAATAALLQRAFTLVPTHGFTHQTLALAGAGTASAAQLTDTSITALFGPGDDARRAFIQAWLDDATAQSISASPAAVVPPSTAALKQALASRLHANTPVLHHLSEAFGLLSAPDMRIAGRTLPALPVLDPRAGLAHAWRVADRACIASGLGLDGTDWYTRRTAVAGIYAASELHQLASPSTAEAFMSGLVDGAEGLSTIPASMSSFGAYFVRSWRGIIRSSGHF